MKMHLRYDLMDAGMRHNEARHARVVMQELGITYQHATPQSLGDQWWFWNCEVPAGLTLPGYITRLDIDPVSTIGYGLTKEKAEEIKAAE